jgi:hypothetical protein
MNCCIKLQATEGLKGYMVLLARRKVTEIRLHSSNFDWNEGLTLNQS